MHWDVYEVSLDLIRMLRQAVVELGRRDPSLAGQLKRAASSVPLNLSEGRRRVGKDRLHCFRIAFGSAQEIKASLDAARAWGDIDEETVAQALELVDRVLAMLWRILHRR
jgi:four helix bundle protein